ncbi:MAG: hypothetical protein WBG22_06640 [Rhodanobacter sp.]
MAHSIRLHYSDHGMKRAFHIRPRTRRRLAWLVALLLLWQQVAVAAYACTVVPSMGDPVAAVTSSPAMAAMGDCADMRQVPLDPLCQQHCQPNQVTQVDAHTASVPFNALAVLPPMFLSVAAVTLPSDRALARRDRLRAPPPIARLLFCSLLI